MKLFSFFLLPLLLCSTISYGFAAKIENQREIRRESKNTTTKFTNLNDDVQYLIFELILQRVGFMELTYLVEAIPSTLPVALDAIRTSGYTVTLQRDIVYNIQDVRFEDYEQKIGGSEVTLFTFSLASKILKKYGSSLRKIHINHFYHEKNELDEISHLINEYARESLTDLNLCELQESTFEQYTVPFENVEQLTFVVTANKIQSGTFPLNKAFPNLRRLVMYLKSSVDYRFIAVEFPQLQHLDITGSKEALEHIEQLKRFLRKNPQIQSAVVKSMSENFIRAMNDIQHNLEILTIDYFAVEADIRFENVKKFTVWRTNPNSIRRLSFSGLQSLDLIYSRDCFDAWIEFFERHQDNLTDLYVHDGWGSGDMPLIKFTAGLPNLVSMSWSSKYIKSDTLIQFIEDHPRLMELQFSKSYFYNGELVQLRNRFESEWSFKMTEFDWVLERLNPNI